MNAEGLVDDFAEFEQVPDTPFKQELIDGELIEFPPNTYRHSIISFH